MADRCEQDTLRTSDAGEEAAGEASARMPEAAVAAGDADALSSEAQAERAVPPRRGTRTHIVRGVAFAALGGICWGLSALCSEFMTGDLGVPVTWIMPFRLSGAAIVFLIICMLREPGNVLAAIRDVRSMIPIVAFAVLGVLALQIGYMNAIVNTNAGTEAVLERFGLVLIMAFVCLRNRRLPRTRELIGLIAALFGTFLIATQGNLTDLILNPAGVAWSLLAAVAFACVALLPDKPLVKWGSLIVTGIAVFVATIISLIVMRPWEITVEPSTALLIAITFSVLVGTVGAYLFFLQGIADAGPLRAGLVSCVVPMVTALCSSVWLGAEFSLPDVVGCALIAVMIILVAEGDTEASLRPSEPYEGSRGDIPVFEGVANELGSYDARRADKADLRDMKHLLESGRRTVKRLGIKEELKKYPSARRLQRALDENAVYVVETQEYGNPHKVQRVIGMFGLDAGGDPSYDECRGATWTSECPGSYAALHWVNVEPMCRRCGVGAYILGAAEDIARDSGAHCIRCDIHEANGPARNLLVREGYSECGTVTLCDWKGRRTTHLLYEKAI